MLNILSAAVLPAAQPLAQTAPSAVTVLQVQRRSIEVKGRPASVLAVRQPDGTPGLVTAVGRRFRVHLENKLDVPTLIHWHGLTPPWQQDGVPGVSGPPIAPGGSADYDFPLRFGGTFWMHSHQGLQEQELLAAPLIIHDERDRPDQQEIVVMLADFSFTPPEKIFENRRKGSSMAGMPSPSAGKPNAMGAMAMPAKPVAAKMAPMASTSSTASGPDLNDVTYDAFLANDRTLADPEVKSIEPGGTILLRVINSSSMSSYHLDLGRLNGELIAVDGFRVQPVAGRRFPISVAQRLDIRIAVPREPAAYPVLAVLEGEHSQTGLILKAGNRASVLRVPEMAANASPPVNLDLVPWVVHSAGYRRFSLTRALAVVNCQSALVWLLLRCACQAAISSASVRMFGMRRSRHWDDKTLSSTSAIFNQLPCVGVKCHSNRSTSRRASAGGKAS